MLTLMVALVPILVFGLLLGVVTVPFVAVGPGPTFDTLGEYDGKPVVAIEGTPVKPTSGQLNMTTVSQRDGLTLARSILRGYCRLPTWWRACFSSWASSSSGLTS